MKQMMQEAFWVSVVERLPEVNVTVLLCDKDGNMITGNYTGEMFEDFYGSDLYDITNWMPLPKPPESKTFGLQAQINTQIERGNGWRTIAAEWQEKALESQSRELAALEDIKAMQSDLPYGVGCYYCGHYTPAGGDGKCGEGCDFEWRGPQDLEEGVIRDE